ncbi:hypothetical protein LI073_13675, partial [bacterium 210917-SL.2.15]|nr:hypothetical protein [bacterium 210917-SL.2.15]
STKSADQVDSFGRPATTWVYDGSTVGTYADDADDSIVLNKSIDAQKAIVTDSDYMNYGEDDVASTIAVYVNGDKQDGITTYAKLANLNLQAGDEIETFENDDNEISTIAVLRYSLAQIDEIETNLSSTYTKQGASVSITLQGLDETGIGSTYYDKYNADSDKELAGYTPDYEEDTVLAVAVNEKNVVLDSYVAESHSGKITAYNSGSKAKVTLEGTEYPTHAVVNTANGDKKSYASEKISSIASLSTMDFNYNDSTYAVYTDKNGYVIGIDETESVKIEDVYYVTGVTKSAGMYSGAYYAQAVSLVDGSVTEFKLDNSDSANIQANTTALGNGWNNKELSDNFFAVQKLCTFDKSGSTYTAKEYKTGSDSTYYVYGTVAASNATNLSDDLAKDDSKLTVNDKKVYLNDKTNYVKVESYGDDIDTKFVTGGTSVKKTWVDGKTTYGTSAIAVTTKSGSNYTASYVVLVSGNFNMAGSEDVVYVHERSNTAVSYKNADGDNKTGYSTELYFLDGSGKVETVTVVGRKAAGFYTYEINDDGVYELTDNADQLSLNAAYDDETGYVKNLQVTGVYNNALTTADVNRQKVEDVDFAENVIIADERGKADRDKDLYTSEITSVSQLKSAIDKKGSNGTANQVIADVYFDDGKVIMVNVLSMTSAKGETPDVPEKGTNSLSLSNSGIVTVTLAKAATEATDVEVTVKQLNGSFTLPQTVTVAKDATSGTLDISKVLEEGKTYTVTATVGGESCTDTAVYRK